MFLITQGKTNLTYLLIVIVIAIIAGGGILFYYYSWIADLDARLAQIELKLPPEPSQNSSPECVKDSDCKLIYGSCNCISVPADMDEQEAIEKLPDKEKMCFVNDCQMKNAQAVCSKGACRVEFSKDKTANWEVYKNTELSYEFKYLSHWSLASENTGSGYDGSKPFILHWYGYISDLPECGGGIGLCRSGVNATKENIEKGTIDGIISFDGGKGVLTKGTNWQGGGRNPWYKLFVSKDNKWISIQVTDMNTECLDQLCKAYFQKISLPNKVNDPQYKTYNDFIDLIKNTFVIR